MTATTPYVNLDLTYAVCFNLANAYQKNEMYSEALNTYSLIVKNKQYPQSGRLRVNMGNIYFKQKKHPNAIKMYRMALDQIPNTGKEIRYRIMGNIGTAFVRLGQFQDAVQSFEAIMEGRAALALNTNKRRSGIEGLKVGDEIGEHYAKFRIISPLKTSEDGLYRSCEVKPLQETVIGKRLEYREIRYSSFQHFKNALWGMFEY